jgi:uncharacterized protein (DUF924 family)
VTTSASTPASTPVTTADKLVAFWFSERVRPLWFKSTPEFDAELREDYLPTYRAALRGELAHWAETPEGALALVVCLDQLPLNMFRGEVESFAGEAPSREIAQTAIERGFDQSLDDAQKAFLYMPFMHSEELADQDRVLALFAQAGLTDNLHWAKHHRDIVARFGRFPHRNAILGRVSTPEELAYLASEEAFLG